MSILGWGLFAAGPSFQLLASDLQAGLTDEGRGGAGRNWHRMGRGFVVIELAVAMILLVSAGLLGQSFYRLLQRRHRHSAGSFGDPACRQAGGNKG
jgi:macrolide transport system ATP-binding/permease protein